MSSHLKAELAATCSTLGRLHKGEYLIEPDCFESVKDLIRYLKRDDESHEIRRYLGESKVLQNDLVYIIKSCPEENANLFDVTLRLLINLTTPPMLFYKNELPTDKFHRNIYLSLIDYAQCYKNAFCDVEFWSKVCGKLTTLFEADFIDRSADDGIQIERILMLLRNVLQIPADEESEKRPDNDITVHDKVLWALRQSQILELLLFISANRDEEQYFLNLLEIFSLVLREQNAKVLAQCDIYRAGVEKAKDEEKLVKIREYEKRSRNKYHNVRNFNTTFVVKGVKSLSNKDVICHKFVDKGESLKPSGLNKKQLRTGKNRVPVESDRPERRSPYSIRLFLKEFCEEFLTNSFTNLMSVVKNKIVSGKSLANDQSYYFWALKFFLEFAVASNADVAVIQDLMSAETFHFAQMSIDDALRNLAVDKKRASDWVKRIHLLLKAYRSLLETLMWMDCSKNALSRSISREIKSQVFYITEYREMILQILLRYDTGMFSLSYLRDLIETAHLFIKLLEEYSKHTKIIVQKVTKRKRKGRRKEKEKVKVTQEEKWDKIKDDVYDTLCSESQFPEIPPFDASLEIPIDDQKGRAMKNIQKLLLSEKIRDGIGLLRSARQVWPENDFFGSAKMTVEDEVMALQEICLADLGDIDGGKSSPPPDGDFDDEEEESEEEGEVEIVEKEFDILEYKKRLVNRKVIEGCGNLLKNYQKNSEHTNHCIIKLLYRIGWECCMPAMLYQASLFWTLLKILKDKSQKYNEINTFTVNLVRRFRKHATQHPVVFLDLLFWKDQRVALEIQHGYEEYPTEPKSSKRSKKSKKSGKDEEQQQQVQESDNDGVEEQQVQENDNYGVEEQRVQENDNNGVEEQQVQESENIEKQSVYTGKASHNDIAEDKSILKSDTRVVSPNREISSNLKKKSKSSLKPKEGKGTKKKTRSSKNATKKKTRLNKVFSSESDTENTNESSPKQASGVAESNEASTSSWNADNFVKSDNLSIPQKTKDDTLSKKRVSETDDVEESISRSKRSRYISSDSDNHQSEDEDLVPVRKRNWKKLAVIDSASEEEPIEEDISSK